MDIFIEKILEWLPTATPSICLKLSTSKLHYYKPTNGPQNCSRRSQLLVKWIGNSTTCGIKCWRKLGN